MRSIGAVEGGADTVLDALTAFFADGLLLAPDPECIVTAPGIPPGLWRGGPREGTLTKPVENQRTFLVKTEKLPAPP